MSLAALLSTKTQAHPWSNKPTPITGDHSREFLDPASNQPGETVAGASFFTAQRRLVGIRLQLLLPLLRQQWHAGWRPIRDHHCAGANAILHLGRRVSAANSRFGHWSWWSWWSWWLFMVLNQKWWLLNGSYLMIDGCWWLLMIVEDCWWWLTPGWCCSMAGECWLSSGYCRCW